MLNMLQAPAYRAALRGPWQAGAHRGGGGRLHCGSGPGARPQSPGQSAVHTLHISHRGLEAFRFVKQGRTIHRSIKNYLSLLLSRIPYMNQKILLYLISG